MIGNQPEPIRTLIPFSSNINVHIHYFGNFVLLDYLRLLVVIVCLLRPRTQHNRHQRVSKIKIFEYLFYSRERVRKRIKTLNCPCDTKNISGSFKLLQRVPTVKHHGYQDEKSGRQY